MREEEVEVARAVERGVEELAADHGLEAAKAVLRSPDEWVLSNPSGEEIARWELTRCFPFFEQGFGGGDHNLFSCSIAWLRDYR